LTNPHFVRSRAGVEIRVPVDRPAGHLAECPMPKLQDVVRCGNPSGCQEPLPVPKLDQFRLAVAVFPRDLSQCYLHLADGPNTISCPVCSYRNEIADATLVTDAEGDRAVAYVTAADDPSRARAGAVEQAVRRHFPGIEIVDETRAFRRAFLIRFVAPHAAALNEAVMTSQPLFSWVGANAARLGYEFMAAIWLLLRQAVPVAAKPVDPEDPESRRAAGNPFRPNAEDTPDFASAARRAAEAAIADTAGKILACRLLILAFNECGPLRSWTPAFEALPDLCPRELLGSPAADALAAEMGHFADRFPYGEKGAIFGRYAVDAVHALLHRHHGTDNPRRADWTHILAVYEYRRRRDGNDEAFLLTPEIVRATIDREGFFAVIQHFGQELQRIDAENQEAFIQLLETVERIFPGQASRMAEIEILPTEGMEDEAVLAMWSQERLGRHLDDNPYFAEKLVRSLLAGLARHRPALVEPIARRAVATLEGRADTVRLRCLSNMIEILNLYHHYGLALELAEAEAEAAGLKGDGGWPPSGDEGVAVTFLNELGNCYRYAHRFPEALDAYERAMEHHRGEAEDRNTRVVLQNQAIVMRSMGLLSEARAIFRNLREEAGHYDALGLVLSEAVCWLVEGRGDAALDLLDANRGLMEGRGPAEPEVRGYLMAYAQLLFNAQRRDEAGRYFALIAPAARRQHDLVTAAVAEALGLRCRAAGLDGETYVHERDAVIRALRDALPQARELAGIPTALLGLGEHLVACLRESGEEAEAEATARAIAEDVMPTAPDAWLLRLTAADLAAERGDGAALMQDLEACLVGLDAAVRSTDPAGDPFSLLRDREGQLVQLTSHLVESVESGAISPDALRLVADIHASPVFTSRLGGVPIDGTEEPVHDVYGDAAVTALLRPAGAGLLQMVETGRMLALVITRIEGGDAVSVFEPLGIDRPVAEAIGRKLDFRLRRTVPGSPALKLDGVAGWPDLEDRLQAAVARHLAPGTPLCLVAGVLGTVPLSLALGDDHPLAFVPSLAAAQVLRARHLALPGGLSWHPRSVFDFVVWRSGDKPGIVEAMMAASARLAELAAAHGLPMRSATGAGATAEALLEGLGGGDLVRLSCHGQARPDAISVDLLVAAGGALPPSVVQAYTGSHGGKYLLGWERLAEAPGVPPLIISSACDSGLAILHPGGERLGLERPFLKAGAVAFVAPQWPVPVAEIQTLTSDLTSAILDRPGVPLARILWDVRAAAASAGVSPLTTAALAVFGDVC
jgi:tetratricopeptide (TPR) repeat protein